MIIKLLVASAMLGFAISYRSVYLFHVILIAAAFLYVSKAAIRKSVEIRHEIQGVVAFFLALYLWCITGIAWHPDIAVWARYQIYLTFGIFTIFSILFYSNDLQALKKLFWIASSVALLNIGIGFIETLTALRYPISAYSKYATHFGYTPANINHEFTNTYSLPTGFNWNPNSFGFFVTLCVPFFIYARRRTVSLLMLPICIYLLLATGSRASVLTILLLIMLLFVSQNLSHTKVYMTAFGLGAILLAVMLPAILGIKLNPFGDVLSTLREAESGLEMLIRDSYLNNSIGTRAGMYRYGIEKLTQTFGLGLGWGGIESLLIRDGFRITSFHFFFLQLLIDLGFFFILVLWGYLSLSIKLYALSSRSPDPFLAYLARACAVSLMTAIPGSIGPSGVHYFLPFFVLVGLALSVYFIITSAKR